jgi:phage gpG-like protein
MASEGFSARIIIDEFTPFSHVLQRELTAPQRILNAIGTEVVLITQQAFKDESLRVSVWAPKRDGSPATLIKSGFLRFSIRITNIGDTTVTVGSDRIYAAIQQLGGTIVPKSKRVLVFSAGGTKVFAKKVTIPPRPFFPIDAQGNLSAIARDRIAGVINDALRVIIP